MTNYDDVQEFFNKFGFTVNQKPTKLPASLLHERALFLIEELNEFIQGCGFQIACFSDNGVTVVGKVGGVNNIEEQADALIDLVYVAIGTAIMLGLPWQELWNDVHRANMEKIFGKTKRNQENDCMKPPDWNPPNTLQILLEAGYNPNGEQHD